MKKLIVLLFALILPPTALGQVPWLSLAGSQPQNEFLATPNGSIGAVGLRAITPADLPESPPETLRGNATSSSATPQDLNPLAVANMMSAVISVDVVSTSNLSLSGNATVDGIVLANGNLVLAQAQTTTSQNGIYVVNAGGPWNRAANFPSGYVIAQNCDIIIAIREGTQYGGGFWQIPTSSGPITIGTTGFTPIGVNNPGTATRPGTVYLGSPGGAARAGGIVTNPGDCADWVDTGELEDLGDINHITGFCVTEDPTSGHINIQNGGYLPTASVGTLNAHSTDHWGIIDSLSSATSVTVTFSATFTNPPACVANASVALTTAPYVSAISATAVTFSFSSLAGSLYYNCFGTN